MSVKEGKRGINFSQTSNIRKEEMLLIFISFFIKLLGQTARSCLAIHCYNLTIQRFLFEMIFCLENILEKFLYLIAYFEFFLSLKNQDSLNICNFVNIQELLFYF